LTFAKAFSTPQNQIRESAGWIEVAEARSPVEFVAVQGSIESHERNDVFFRLPKGLAAKERIFFRYETDFTYLFSHTWSQVDRRYWWSELPPMALAVAVDDRHAFVPPLPGNSHVLEVLAGPPERLHLFLPRRVKQETPRRLNGIFTDNEWLWMQDVSNRFNGEGRFVTLNGYERAGDQGHWNFYTSADRLELFRGMNMDPDKNTLQSACERVSDRPNVVAGPHVHHGRYSFEYKSGAQCFHELYSMWGNYEKLTYGILNKGAVIGVTGGGDNHEARGGFSGEDPEGQGTTPHTFAPSLKWKTGLTAALMPRLGRKGLIQALRERQTYATTGPRILIEFSVSGVSMGGKCKVGGDTPTILAIVRGVCQIARVEIIRDGQTEQSIRGDGRDLTVKWVDSAVGPGRHWYLLKVIQTDQEMAWTSPIWVNRD